MIISITSGNITQPYNTEKATVGDLFADEEFCEDFCIPSNAIPMVNGESTSRATALESGMTISYVVVNSQKGANTAIM